ncbi:MAG: hypothetical protein ACYDBP_11650 [Leptospirales bacterium]
MIVFVTASPAILKTPLRPLVSSPTTALHWRREAVFGEDRSPVRKGFGPQNMAAIRNLAIGLLGMVVRILSKKGDVPPLLQHHAWFWRHVFTLLGL